jgi:RNA polymerase sigma factor (sigma-70 family)
VDTGDIHVDQLDRRIERIFKNHQGFVRALAVRMAPLPGFEEDISQQVFLEFLQKRDQWDLDRDVKPLLAQMTRNVCRRYWRERSRGMPEKMRELAEHMRRLAAQEELSWYGDEEKDALKECLEKVPERSRKILSLRYEMSLSTKDLAKEFRMSANAVRQVIHRVQRRLKECIEEAMGEESHV